MLADTSESATLKATDFGLSVFFKGDEVYRDIVGSAYYVAPEVLRRHYSKEADIWSCGVILYILVCGVPPFWGDTEQQIFDSILKGRLDFSSDPWPTISLQAQDCIKRMLVQVGAPPSSDLKHADRQRYGFQQHAVRELTANLPDRRTLASVPPLMRSCSTTG